MNSVVYLPERWVELLAAAKKERARLGLEGKVLLSHNFTHHIEIADDFVARMDTPRRKALANYMSGLDALSLSQYMDLAAACRWPIAASDCPPPTRSRWRSRPREGVQETS